MEKTSDALVKRGGAEGRSPLDENKELIVTPPADIYETDEAYVVLLDMPGAAKDSITLTMEDGALQVKAPATGHHGPTAALLYREISGGTYRRVFAIGGGVDAERVDAAYEDGVLAVKLYKSEKAKPKQIAIKVK